MERPMPPRTAFLAMLRTGAECAAMRAIEFFDGFFELGFGDEAVDHAEFEGALGGYRLAGQDDLERDFRTDKIGQDRGG